MIAPPWAHPAFVAGPFIVLLGILLAPAAREETPAGSAPPAPPGKAPAREDPIPMEGRGRLICLAEEMRDRWKAEVPPVHDHILGFRREGEVPGAEPVYSTILRTAISEGLFADERFRKNELVLSGRLFPRSAVIEVTRTRWIREGKLYDIDYWCGVCAIQGSNPASCACCQGEVELRERLVEKGP